MASTLKVEFPPELFDVTTNVPLIHQVVVAQLAAARQGTHKTKNRGEVSGAGRKPWKQKGTGRARMGSIRAPQTRGGGVVHGPTPRDYSQRTPKKMIAAALLGALSDRARGQRIHVLAKLVEDDVPSTRVAAEAIAEITQAKRVLIVLTRDDELSYLSVRNLPEVHVLTQDQLNAYDVLLSDDVIFVGESFDEFVTAKLRAAKLADGQEASEQESAPSASTKKTANADDEAQPVDGGFGEDSAAPLEDGSAPAGFDIKGNKDSMKFHRPDGRWYEATEAEVWFRTAEAAEAAGFVEAGKSSKTDDTAEESK